MAQDNNIEEQIHQRYIKEDSKKKKKMKVNSKSIFKLKKIIDNKEE